VTRSALMKRIPGSTSPLNALIKKGIFEQYEKEVSRLGYKNAEALPSSITLNAVQQEAFDKIREEFREKHVVLLHGVTSSGKTELYIRMIDEVLSQGKQVLYLLPEIALTSQIINRLQKYFGNRVGVYHSRFDENERVEIWQRIAGIQPEGLASSYQVILGARSALFLPYSNLGLVIIDEEHDPSFKQHDPAPRYNARDAAIYLAGLHDAKVLLGSATPSVESYYNAVIGKFGLALLPERFGGMMMPDIRVINLKEEHKLKRMHSIFSVTLTEAIESALARKEQVILFQNRRGFSLQLLCDSCDWVPQCVQCDVSLVYHKKQNVLRCHYCGYSTRIPEECPDCGNTGIRMKGFGTEQIEEELSLIFPEASIARMDLDTTRSKYAYQRLISDFEERRIDILTGTQMITKGLDFDNVALVGILNADGIINFPDFRSFERAFQLMAQVAGRAGRKNSQGTVMIQAFNTSHPVIDLVLKHDYKGLYAQQVEERNKFRYPPIYRLIQVTLKHPDAGKLNRAADLLATALYKEFGKRVLGPEYPFVSRIKNLFLKNILLKLEKGASLPVSKQKLMDAIKLLHAQADFSTVRVQVDVDPM
jgi:primosomal protein N' (replication factor Y)